VNMPPSIPAERMKMREEHVVPLSTQANAVLEELKAVTAGRRPQEKDRPGQGTALASMFLTANTMPRRSSYRYA